MNVIIDDIEDTEYGMTVYRFTAEIRKYGNIHGTLVIDGSNDIMSNQLYNEKDEMLKLDYAEDDDIWDEFIDEFWRIVDKVE